MEMTSLIGMPWRQLRTSSCCSLAYLTLNVHALTYTQGKIDRPVIVCVLQSESSGRLVLSAVQKIVQQLALAVYKIVAVNE